MTKIIPKFFGNIEGNKLTMEDPNGFKAYLSRLKGRVTIVVKKFRKQRSPLQNNWYWACVETFANFSGTDKDDMHATLKAMYLGFDPNNQFPILRSTADLNSEEFTEYMNCIQRLAIKHNIRLPHPDEFEMLLPPPEYLN